MGYELDLRVVVRAVLKTFRSAVARGPGSVRTGAVGGGDKEVSVREGMAEWRGPRASTIISDIPAVPGKSDITSDVRRFESRRVEGRLASHVIVVRGGRHVNIAKMGEATPILARSAKLDQRRDQTCNLLITSS